MLALLVVALVSTAVLITELIKGGKVTQSADSLLASGALIWLGNVLVFSLLYWLLDSGGPLARFRGEREFPDFAFTQQMSPELAPLGWHPGLSTTSVSGGRGGEERALERGCAREARGVTDGEPACRQLRAGLVLFAASLFFAGISTKLHSLRQREVLLGLGWVFFIGTAVWIATFPVKLSI